MRLEPKDVLQEHEIERGLRAVVRDGLASQAMATLTGGVFLVSFALRLGASNVVIGLLAAIPPLAQLLQLPSVYLVQRLANRRGISVYASAISRVFWIPIALIPWVAPGRDGLILLAGALGLHAGFAAVSNCAWAPWIHDLVPQERLGAFFSKRMARSVAIGLLLSLLAGLFIDRWKAGFPQQDVWGYSVLFLLGAVAGLLGVYFLATTPERRMAPEERHAGWVELLRRSFRDRNFRRVVWFLGAWSFSINLAAPFFTVYLLKELEFSLTVVVGLSALSQVVNILFVRIWGELSDRLSNKSVLAVSGPLLLLSILGWTFTTMPGRYVLTMPLLVLIHILMGIALAGVALGSSNISLKLAPRGQATAYLATSNLVNSVSAGIAPLVGGILADVFARRELSWTLSWSGPSAEFRIETLNFQHWDFLFFIAFLIGLYALHRLAYVREIGEASEKETAQALVLEVRRSIRSLSTFGGVRALIQFPYALVHAAKRSSYRNDREGPS
jgi:MFS family permease